MFWISIVIFSSIDMNLSLGPKKLTKLTLFKSIADFTVSDEHPLLLAVTEDHCLSTYHL